MCAQMLSRYPSEKFGLSEAANMHDVMPITHASAILARHVTYSGVNT